MKNRSIASFIFKTLCGSAGLIPQSSDWRSGSDNHSTRVRLASFTLVELLIVIAILAVLAAAVVLVLNPAELLAQARDTQRITDLKNLNESVNIFVLDNSTVSLGASQTIHLSLPDTSATCATYSSLPTLPAGWSYKCATEANLRKTDGTGWIPVNFNLIKGGSTIPYLPIDPTNDAVSGKYYTYTPGGSFELTALLEAEKHEAAVRDGGYLPGTYQVGSHLDLTPVLRDGGLRGYWNFDSVSSNSVYDGSGSGNTGTMYSASSTVGSLITSSGCKRGSCVVMDGVDDSVRVPYSASLAPTGGLTISVWAYKADWTTPTGNNRLVSKTEGGGYQIAVNGGSSDDIYAIVMKGGSYRAVSTIRSTLSPGWHQFVTTFDGRYLKIFKDGVSSATFDSGVGGAIQYACSNSLIIGGESGCGTSPAGDGPYSGLLDEIMVYGRALSDKEVELLYNRPDAIQ